MKTLVIVCMLLFPMTAFADSFWCTQTVLKAGMPTIGFCFADSSTCTSKSKQLRKEAVSVGKCKPTKLSACFLTITESTQSVQSTCFDSYSTCNGWAEASADNADVGVRVSQCTIWSIFDYYIAKAKINAIIGSKGSVQ